MPSWSVLTSGWGRRPGREVFEVLRLDSRDKGKPRRERGGMKGHKTVSCFLLAEAKEGETGIGDC